MKNIGRIIIAAICVVALTAASRKPLVLNGAQQQQLQSGDTLTLPNVASGTQCIHADSSGNLTGTGSDCGSSSGALPLAVGVWRFDTGTTSSSPTNNFAAHGNVFTPDHAITVYALSFTGTTVTSATYEVCAALWSFATSKITTAPVCSASWSPTTGSASKAIAGTLTTPLAVAKDTAFAVYFVRTDGMGTTSATTNITGTAPVVQPGFGTQTEGAGQNSAALDLASTNPGTGDTWTVTSTTVWHVGSILYAVN